MYLKPQNGIVWNHGLPLIVTTNACLFDPLNIEALSF
jgi:hypothetical protein